MPAERPLWCHVLAVATGIVTFCGSLSFDLSATSDMARVSPRVMFVSARYFSGGVPVCYLVAGVLGYLGPIRSWRWSLDMIGTHFVGSMLFMDSGPDLWPLVLVVAVVLALPGIVTAWLGACVFRIRRAMREADR